MKITMYELLGMVKNGKAPKRVKFHNSIYDYDKDRKDYFYNTWLLYSMNGIELAEEEVEIIEDKKIEKMSDFYTEHITENGRMTEIFNKHELAIIDKINEIIDYLNSKGDE